MIPIHILGGMKSIPHSSCTSICMYLYNGSFPPCLCPKYPKNSGSIPRKACVTCETQLRKVWVSEWVSEWLFNVTINDISVIYVTAHRCAGGLKKELDLRSGLPRHRHFVGFFNVPVLAPTRDQPFYTVISESVTDGRTDSQTDGQSDPYVSLCFAGDTKKVATTLGRRGASKIRVLSTPRKFHTTPNPKSVLSATSKAWK